jgi:hypothetical protein
MTMRVSAGARPRVVQTEKRTCTRQKLETGERVAHRRFPKVPVHVIVRELNV